MSRQTGLCFRKITHDKACGMHTSRLNSICEALVKNGTEEGLAGFPAVPEQMGETVPPTSSARVMGSPKAASP